MSSPSIATWSLKAAEGKVWQGFFKRSFADTSFKVAVRKRTKDNQWRLSLVENIPPKMN
jgi:hypothetical protein